MNSDIAFFWESTYADRVQHPGTLRSVLTAANALGDKRLFDLAFYSSFAVRVLSVMKREGPDAQGFGRMQQSFTEAVQQVRTILQEMEASGFREARAYSELSQAAMEKLIALMEDLSIVKLWQNTVDTTVERESVDKERIR